MSPLLRARGARGRRRGARHASSPPPTHPPAAPHRATAAPRARFTQRQKLDAGVGNIYSRLVSRIIVLVPLHEQLLDVLLATFIDVLGVQRAVLGIEDLLLGVHDALVELASTTH